jgi:hypothetical protein
MARMAVLSDFRLMAMDEKTFTARALPLALAR